MRWLLLSIVTCLALVGCNKSERANVPQPAGPPPNVTAPEPPADARPTIVVLGDSLAEGLGVERGRTFPDMIQRKLDQRGLAYRVVNLGISGDTTTGGLSRLEHALSFKPQVLILELGGNDGLRGVPVAAAKRNLEEMIVAAQDTGAKVLLAGMTLPPNYGPDYVRDFTGMYRDLARKYHLQLIPFLMQDIFRQTEAVPGLMQPDGIHPTAEGHAIIAETVFRYLQPLVARPAA